MAARGTEEKNKIISDILVAFPNSFVYGKEIRIPCGDVQIKCAITCAKENVNPGGDEAIPGTTIETEIKNTEKGAVAPSEEELNAVNDFMSKLGLL